MVTLLEKSCLSGSLHVLCLVPFLYVSVLFPFDSCVGYGIRLYQFLIIAPSSLLF